MEDQDGKAELALMGKSSSAERTEPVPGISPAGSSSTSLSILKEDAENQRCISFFLAQSLSGRDK